MIADKHLSVAGATVSIGRRLGGVWLRVKKGWIKKEFALTPQQGDELAAAVIAVVNDIKTSP